MHFGFALNSSDIDLWDIDLLDTDLDLGLLDTDIPSKHFLCLQGVSKTSSRHVFTTCLEAVFSVTIFLLPRRLEHVLGDVFKQDALEDEQLLRWRRVKDVYKTCLQEVLKTSWRPANVCWVYCNVVWNKINLSVR